MRRGDVNRERRDEAQQQMEQKRKNIQRHKNKGKEIKDKVQKWKRAGDNGNRREQKRKGVTKVKKSERKTKENKVE